MKQIEFAHQVIGFQALDLFQWPFLQIDLEESQLNL